MYDFCMNCTMCGNSEEFGRLKIREYEYWRIELHGSQYYLGRCIVILKRHVLDLFEINQDEREELFRIIPLLKDSIKKSFGSDMLNYSSLGNEVQHLHLHVIPRYKKTVKFAGREFKDEQWGSNPSPYDKSFKVSDELYGEIVKTITSNLENKF